MPRLTVTLSPTRHRAVKEASARNGKTIGQIIEESLELAGIKTQQEACDLVAKAREHSGLGEEQALDLAVLETLESRSR